MREVYEFLKKCQTYYLATVEGDQPRVRPFGTIDWFEDKLYIQTGKVKDVSKQMQKNPKIEICAFDGERWLRMACFLQVGNPHFCKIFSSLQVGETYVNHSSNPFLLVNA